VKIATGPAGLQMIRGEFESMTAIYSSVSSFAPKPIAWDSITSPESAHFFISDFHNLSEFHDLSEAFPDPVKFTTKLASLHRAGKSPKGMYGFDVPTYNDGLPQDNTWKPTWEEFFANKLRQLLKQEEKAQGADPTLSKLSTSLLDRVVPRLLRPLESDGRSIRPSLIHGNLWYGNASTDLNSGEPIIFGACSFWAHNECIQHLPFCGMTWALTSNR
jgi:protein-ribulosamine 3-kinase